MEVAIHDRIAFARHFYLLAGFFKGIASCGAAETEELAMFLRLRFATCTPVMPFFAAKISGERRWS
jgi:hypothetical protein